MQIPVLIERVEGNGYRARGGEPFAVTAEGATRDEALQRLLEVIKTRLADAECVLVEVPTTENPLVQLEGVYKDDPLFDEWQTAIAEYRRQVDLDPDAR
jgi:predicted RNase H-like HicB family nuclease